MNAPTLTASEYLITAVVPRFGEKPIVVTSVLGQFGWCASWRDSRHRLRQTLRRTKEGAVTAVIRIAPARAAP